MFNINQLFNGAFARLANIPRFSIYTRVFDESVAEHSYYVAVFSAFLFDHFASQNAIDRPPASLSRILVAALGHDLDEAWSGDINGPFKHMLPAQVRSSMESDGLNRVREEMGAITKGQSVFHHIEHLNEMEEYILKLADIMSLVMFISRERRAENMAFLSEINLVAIKMRLRAMLLDRKEGEWFRKVIEELLMCVA